MPATDIPIRQRQLVALALDPIHVGTGEFRLGRVDNTIVRDPGTNLPKIPGASIAGVTRAYLAMLSKFTPPGSPGEQSRYLYEDGASEPKKLRSCAGKGGADGTDHCGKASCPVCAGFGFSRNGVSFQGLFTFTDAAILLFPVASVLGPLWVTSPGTLEEAGIPCSSDGLLEGGVYKVKTAAAGRVNLGWLSLEAAAGAPDLSSVLAPLNVPRIAGRIALVHDDIFSAIVGDNLEVRTSVSIDPATGTAARGALFTAEAIPRGTVFHFGQSTQHAEFFRVPGEGGGPIAAGDLHTAVYTAMRQMEWLGVGGLNTRGMGRLRVAERRAPGATL